MENKEEIKRIDGKYFLIRELETNGEPINIDGEMLQPIKPINDDDDYDCQHCFLYETDDCGEPCSGGFFVRVLPENGKEKDAEKLSNVEETGENLEPKKEETTMERKIGEIFEYNGDWYQCVEQPKDYIGEACKICAFRGIGNCELDECAETYRSDKKNVIFKKLEKVGDPIMLSGKWAQKILIPNQDDCDGCCFNMDECIQLDKDICGASEIYVEIKQNKEYMEENELIELLSEKVHNAWMKEKEAQGFSYGEKYDKEKKKHPDMLPYNKLKEEVKEYDRATVKAVLQAQKELSADVNKLNLKPFSIEAAKAGKPVCTRDGRKARIICFDSKNDLRRPIVALVEYNGNELLYEYTIEGKDSFSHISTTGTSDLMMLPEKKEGWVNVYKRKIANKHEYFLVDYCKEEDFCEQYKLKATYSVDDFIQGIKELKGETK